MALKGVALGCALDFDKTAAAIHYDVHVGFGARVFRVVEVKQRHAIDNPHRHRRNLSMQWVGAQRTAR